MEKGPELDLDTKRGSLLSCVTKVSIFRLRQESRIHRESLKHCNGCVFDKISKHTYSKKTYTAKPQKLTKVG